jgi:hypothetical protein
MHVLSNGSIGDVIDFSGCVAVAMNDASLCGETSQGLPGRAAFAFLA